MTDVRQLYKEESPKLKRFFAGKVADQTDIDELVQDTFLHVLDALPLFRHESNMWTFVSSYALAGILGLLLFKDATAILNPQIYGPGTSTP